MGVVDAARVASRPRPEFRAVRSVCALTCRACSPLGGCSLPCTLMSSHSDGGDSMCGRVCHHISLIMRHIKPDHAPRVKLTMRPTKPDHAPHTSHTTRPHTSLCALTRTTGATGVAYVPHTSPCSSLCLSDSLSPTQAEWQLMEEYRDTPKVHAPNAFW